MTQKKLLVLDDEEEIVSILVEALGEETDFEVTGFTNPFEALESAANDSYNIILSDVRMPKMNGIDFIRTLRTKHNKSTPVILMTGFSDVSLEEAKKAGASTMLNKPWEFLELISEIERLSE